MASLWRPFHNTQDMVGGIPLKRILSLFLAVLSAALLLCAIHPAWAASPAAGSGKPYYIMVNRAQSTVTIYERDEAGRYTVPVKAMVCSTGRRGHATPTGTFTIGGRWSWLHMIDGSYGQYATQISGNILFHSVCYTRRDPSTLMTEEYNGLGAPASLGCVRLQTADAKWIYDNCARGTRVTIYDDADDPGPLGKPDKLVEHISDDMANGWDPTDPREDNPWHNILRQPSAQIPADQAVSYSMMAQALYQLSGEQGLLTPTQMLNWAINHRLLEGLIDKSFQRSAPMTRQDLIAMLYRYETEYLQRAEHTPGSLARFTDSGQIHNYAVPAMRWAVGAGLIQGTSDKTLHPADYATQAQMDTILERYSHRAS